MCLADSNDKLFTDGGAYSFENVFCSLHPPNETHHPKSTRKSYSRKEYQSILSSFINIPNFRPEQISLICRRKRNANRNPIISIVSDINNNLFEKLSAKKLDEYFQNILSSAKFKPDRATASLNLFEFSGLSKEYRVKKIIKEFLERDGIFDNDEYNKCSKKLIGYLENDGKYVEAIWWILFLSLYPEDTNELNHLIKYWEISDLWKKAFFEEPTVTETVSSDETFQPTGITKLALEGVNKFLESFIDPNLEITVDKLNKSIDERNIRFTNDPQSMDSESFPIIDISIPENDGDFQSALKFVWETLGNNDEYRTILKLLVFLPMNRIGAEKLKRVPGVSSTIIQRLKKEKIILSIPCFYVLDYSYEIVFEYMKIVSDNFTKVDIFERFSFLPDDYNIGKWKELLCELFINHRDILNDDEKNALLSQIDFSNAKDLKKIFEKGSAKHG